MSAYDPNFVSVQFSTVSHGYLHASVADLALIKSALPRPATVREKAICAAIDFGLANPQEWERRRRRAG